MFTYSPRRIRLTSPFIHENTGQSAPFNIKEKKKWVSRFHLAGSSLCATAVALVFWGSTQQLAPLPFAALALASATILSYGIEMFSAGKADETLIRSSLSDKIFPPSAYGGLKHSKRTFPLHSSSLENSAMIPPSSHSCAAIFF